ncbi:MAG: hypothetical protein EOP06_21440 [Proteobacteria bacterium]|nr:MAG: hypothetical protein EOP06_21440 [Pseudomonadota bacterium]
MCRLGQRFGNPVPDGFDHDGRVIVVLGFVMFCYLINAELIEEKYRGIRPAPGYPACPDHAEKTKIWRLMQVEERTGIRLTENYAMTPPASVCGYYFLHPEAKYFVV